MIAQINATGVQFNMASTFSAVSGLDMKLVTIGNCLDLEMSAGSKEDERI